MVAIPSTRRKWSIDFVEKILKLHDEKGIEIVPVSSKHYGKMADKTNINFITGGFSALSYVLEICGKENVKAYGFSFLNKEATAKDGGLNRYFETRNVTLTHSWHNFAKESEYLKEVFNIK